MARDLDQDQELRPKMSRKRRSRNLQLRLQAGATEVDATLVDTSRNIILIFIVKHFKVMLCKIQSKSDLCYRMVCTKPA